jgi:hypothetical protein
VSSIQGIAESLGLQKSGGEYKGACPICGGDDRFHIRQGKNHDLLVYCRHGCTYSQIMATLEKAGLVPKTDYIAPRYQNRDLDFADSILMVGRGNLEKNFTFHSRRYCIDSGFDTRKLTRQGHINWDHC